MHLRRTERTTAVTPELLRVSLRSATRDALRPVAILLAVMYALYVVARLTSGARGAVLVGVVDAVAAAWFAGLAVVLRRVSVPDRWVHPLAASYGVVGLVPVLVAMAATDDVHSSIGLLMVMVGSALFVLSPLWLGVVLVVTLAGWIGGWVVTGGAAAWDESWDPVLCGVFLAVAVHVVRRVTQRRLEQAREELRQAAVADELTGLPNRRGFTLVAEQMCREADRDDTRLLLLFIDLDGMKEINDRLGHSAGDGALQDTAALLRRTFRAADLCARLGGDEFCVLVRTEEHAAVLLRRLRIAVQECNAEPGRPYALALSVGSAVYDPGAQPVSLDDLLARADEQMYLDKQTRGPGRGGLHAVGSAGTRADAR